MHLQAEDQKKLKEQQEQEMLKVRGTIRRQAGSECVCTHLCASKAD